MNFVPGEEKEGKMRLIHKEQVAVIMIVFLAFIIIIIICMWGILMIYFIRTESQLSAAIECPIMDSLQFPRREKSLRWLKFLQL